jgi:sarcosine oxidase
VLGGFSGHGFKIAPALGQIGADLATSGETPFDLDFLVSAPPVFNITDVATGTTTHNSVVESAGGPK